MEAEDSPKTGKAMKITLLGSGAMYRPCLYVFLLEWQLAIGFQMAGWKSWGLIVASNKLNAIALVIECIRCALRQTPAKIWAEFLSKKKATNGTGFNYSRQPILIGHVWNEDGLLALGLFYNLSARHGSAQRAQLPPGPQCHRPGPAVEHGCSQGHGPRTTLLRPLPRGMLQAGRSAGAASPGPPISLAPRGAAAGRGGRRAGQGCSPCNCPGISGDSPTLN